MGKDEDPNSRMMPHIHDSYGGSMIAALDPPLSPPRDVIIGPMKGPEDSKETKATDQAETPVA